MPNVIKRYQDFHKLILEIKKNHKCTLEEVWSKLEIRPRLSFAFPRQDITLLDYDEDSQKYSMEVTFLGLYGVSSPLPAHYTRSLMQDCNDSENEESASRDFFDLLNKIIFKKYYSVEHNKYLGHKYLEDNDANLRMLFASFGGILIDENKEDCLSLQLLEMFGQKIRTKYNLKRILRVIMNNADIEVIENVKTLYYIPDHEKNCLGKKNTIIGSELYLGSKKPVNGSKVSMIIFINNSIELDNYHSANFKNNIVKGIDCYLGESLDYDIILKAKGNLLSLTQLNYKSNSLGITAILGDALSERYYSLKIYDSEIDGRYYE